MAVTLATPTVAKATRFTTIIAADATTVADPTLQATIETGKRSNKRYTEDRAKAELISYPLCRFVSFILIQGDYSGITTTILLNSVDG